MSFYNVSLDKISNESDKILNSLLDKNYNEMKNNYNKYKINQTNITKIKNEIQRRCVHKWIKEDSGCMYGEKYYICEICGKQK